MKLNRLSPKIPSPVNLEHEKIYLAQVGTPVIAAKTTDSAWLNRIDFASEEAGKSAVIVGTTRPVEYKLTKISDKRLRFELLNTNLPEYRNRALITTRFQSAVDRITPAQQPTAKDTVILIELREAVPYIVKQTDNIIKIDFSASSIPPKPYEDGQLPAWKKVMAEPAPATGLMAGSEKKAENAKVLSEAREESETIFR